MNENTESAETIVTSPPGFVLLTALMPTAHETESLSMKPETHDVRKLLTSSPIIAWRLGLSHAEPITIWQSNSRQDNELHAILMPDGRVGLHGWDYRRYDNYDKFLDDLPQLWREMLSHSASIG